MAVELNHTIVHAHGKRASAQFFDAWRLAGGDAQPHARGCGDDL
jgi:hypothetical protein